MSSTIKKLIESSLPEIVKIRHQIHQYPELKYEEHKTAQLVSDTLQSYGYKPTQGIGGTGVVAVLDSGRPGKTVALRADMDALPIQEETTLKYASKRAGLMHACGHDGHTATLLLIAKILKECANQFSGKVKFIFQPAEEGGNGAGAMIKEGVLTNPKVDAIFAYHNSPGIPLGKVIVRDGCFFAGSTWFQIDIKGIGGHSSRPDCAINPVHIGAQVTQNLQTIISSMTSPLEACVLAVTEFHAGTAPNVIPPHATLKGSIRTITDEATALIKKKIQEIAKSTASGYGANADVTFPVEIPPTINTTSMVELVKQTAMTLYSKERLISLSQPYMATEDFSFFLHEVPGCYFAIGNGANSESPPCHHPQFVFHDEIIPIAAEMLISVAINYLH